MPESELELAERIVRDAEFQIADERERIDDMDGCGYTHSATIARARLESLEALVEIHRTRLESLRLDGMS